MIQDQKDPNNQTERGDQCAAEIEKEITALLSTLEKPGKEPDPPKPQGSVKNDDSPENELVSAEKSYLIRAKFLLLATLRNAGIIYKGRLLSYNENKQLRQAYLDSLKQEYDLKGMIKEAIKHIPGVGGGGAAGILLAKALFSDPSVAEYILLVVLFAFLGFVFQFIFSRFTLYYKHQNYIRQDNEMTWYYIQYLERMVLILFTLVDELEAIHQKCFGSKYYDEDEIKTIKKSIRKLVEENNKPNRCKYIDAHIRDGFGN